MKLDDSLPSRSTGERTAGINDISLLTQAQSAHGELQRRNERLELLLTLTKTITSNLDLREVLRSASAHIRQVMHGDFAAISLYDAASGKFKLFVLDYPQRKGFVREDLLLSKSSPGKRAFETLQPVIASSADLARISPEVHEELALSEGARSVCLVPLVNHGRALGLLTIMRTTEEPFVPEEVEFLSQLAGPIAIAIENALAYEEICHLKDKLAGEKLYLEEHIRSEMGFEHIIGNSTALKQVLQLVETVAPTDSTVLLLGETGTGKELIARAIHERSRRKDRTFVKMNCAAIPTGLIESELFGYEKGAFTGAISQKIGRMELADQGTLFLDEVGDIPIEIQPKLLRVLQEREFERLGSTHTRQVNVRLVAATNRDLAEMVRGGKFRNDLFYRLNVFPIHIPPLREREGDIPLLVHYFVADLSRKMRKSIQTIPAEVMDEMAAFSWPGNIRELQNFIERSVILSTGKTLAAPISELKNAPIPREMTGTTFHGMEREMILNVLRATGGKLSGRGGAAERLGLKRTTLQRKMERLGILKSDYA